MLDWDSAFGRRVQRRLRTERIIWLTTVGADLTPQPRPVWFLWEGDSFLVYSRPDTAKLKHIVRSSKVSLHFDGDGLGGDIVVFVGDAEIVEDRPPADQVPAYVEKYVQGFKRISLTPGQFAKEYPVAVRITPKAVRGH